MKRFVVISGLPGSGKSTLARRLAPALGFPIIDKDDLLEELFESEGMGGPERRRALSRRSDALFQQRALGLNQAILVSHWRLPGMPSDSGTPAEWLSPYKLVHLHCVCSPDLAAMRFFERKRHPGHLDSRDYSQILASIQEVEKWGILDSGPRLEVDVSAEPDMQALLPQIARIIELP